MRCSPSQHASPYTRHHEALDNHANEQDIATHVLRLARNTPEQIEGAPTTPRPLRTRTRTSSRQTPEQTISHKKNGGDIEPRISTKKYDCKKITEQKDAGTKILKTYIVGGVQTPSLRAVTLLVDRTRICAAARALDRESQKAILVRCT